MNHTEKPSQPCGSSFVDIRDYFTLWLTKLESFMDERDRANKESVKAAFNAAEKASEKTEAALKEYKLGANEWRDTVKDLIANLRQASAISGSQDIRTKDEGERSRDTRAWLIPLCCVGIIATSSLVVNLLQLLKR